MNQVNAMNQMNALSENIQAFKNIVSEKNVFTKKSEIQKYIVEPRGIYFGNTKAVIKPQNVKQISDIVRICEKYDIKIVPQGGNTGLVGAQIPVNQKSIIISMEKMNAIQVVDEKDKTVILQAGVILHNLNQKLQQYQMRLPLQLGSQQSCQIGGLISTNAGGINTIAYGNMRPHILDIKAVITKGDVIGGTKNLYKNNIGYDLKQLFAGAEGTLGIITDVALKIQNIPKYKKTFFCSIKGYYHAIELLQKLNQVTIAKIEAFEIIKHDCIELYQEYNPNHNLPKMKNHNYYILAELAANVQEDVIARNIEDVLVKAIEEQIVTDAIITKNQNEEQILWNMRHSIGGGGAIKIAGETIPHDIALPLNKLPQFIEKTQNLIKNNIDPNIRIIDYGHLGDGNIHYNVIQPKNMTKENFLKKKNKINEIVYQQVIEHNGSVSAEHGIGIEKKHLIEKVKNKTEINIMRQIKKIFDPQNIFNPQKILPDIK